MELVAYQTLHAAVVDAALIDGHKPWKDTHVITALAAVVDAALIDGHCLECLTRLQVLRPQ